MRARKIALLIFVLAALAVMTPGESIIGSVSGGEETPAYVPGELLIKFQTDLDLNARADVRAQLNAQKVREFRSKAEHWRLPAAQSVEQAIAELRNNPLVDYAEPNYIIEMDYVPNDPMYPDMWDMNNTGQNGGTPGADIDAERAWNVSTGSHDVMVAVIDTGVDYTHPELAANIWTNPGEIAGNSIDDDSNGYIDDIHGWDF
jgi:subtilisin family serine protease